MPRPNDDDRRDLQPAIQQIIDEELDSELSCLKARHILEHEWGLPRDGLLPRKAEFIAAFQRCEPPPCTLSPGERAASWIATCGCGVFLLQRWGMPDFGVWGLVSAIGIFIASCIGGSVVQMVFGSLAGAYLGHVKGLPWVHSETFADECNAWLFPRSDEAKRIRRHR